MVCVAENLLEWLLVGCRAHHEGQWNAETVPSSTSLSAGRNQEQLTPEGT